MSKKKKDKEKEEESKEPEIKKEEEWGDKRDRLRLSLKQSVREYIEHIYESSNLDKNDEISNKIIDCIDRYDWEYFELLAVLIDIRKRLKT